MEIKIKAERTLSEVLHELWEWKRRKDEAARYYRAYVRGLLTGTLRHDFCMNPEIINRLTREEREAITEEVIRELMSEG